MADDGKWDCEACTYKNYTASKKCIICRAQRPLQVITDFENSEQDIYKVAEIEARNSDQWTSNKDTEQKWPCPVCTFLNFTTATVCAECSAQRKQRVLSPAKVSKDLKKPLLVQTSIASSGSLSSCARGVPSSPCFSDGTNIIDLNTSKHDESVGKWACKACTYENSPRSQQCLICRTLRGLTYASSSQAICSSESVMTNKSKLSFEVDSKNQENSKSGQTSPNNIQNENQKRNSGPNSPTGNKSSSGQSSPTNKSSGKSSPNNNSTPHSPTNTNNLNEEKIIPYGSSIGRNSPSNQLGLGSPNNNRSGQVSPQEYSSGQSSPGSKGQNSPGSNRGQNSPGSNRGQNSPGSNRGQSSPLVARASIDVQKRNQNKKRNDALIIQDGGGAIGGYSVDDRRERKLQKLRKKLSNDDLIWINACEAVVNGDLSGIEQYLTTGGDPTRQLTKDEIIILDRPSAFEVGHTLVHLALRFRRDDMVAVLLTSTDIASKGFKRLPSYTCPDLASDIRREVSIMLRQRKGTFHCYFFTDNATFSLPAEIEDLPSHTQTQLFDEILDTDVDKVLTDELTINWSIELTEKLGSRLYALWNRTAGDCLLDSVLQATWGILDIDNKLRNALSDSLLEGAKIFYPRWKEYETMQAHLMNFSLDDEQWQRDWDMLLSLAVQPGAPLEQMHIFALAHILRRPIIVYGVKVVKSFRGESIDFARFEGVYLPFLWERSFCWKSPITLGYTRGHFSALVTMETETDMPLGAGAHLDNTVDEQIAYLPLVDHDGSFLPIHFLTGSEMGQEETVFRRWLDCLVTTEGLFVAMQKIGKRPPSVTHMMESWLDHYRHEGQGHIDHSGVSTQNFSSDEESEQE